MARGYFPLQRPDKDAEKLVCAADLVNEVCECIGYADDQFDNAAADGASLARLRLAIELIRREVKPEVR